MVWMKGYGAGVSTATPWVTRPWLAHNRRYQDALVLYVISVYPALYTLVDTGAPDGYVCRRIILK